jgi:hypothetical protein
VNSLYEELVDRIRGEVPDLDRVVQRALRAWTQTQMTSEEQLYLDSVALNLHGFYSGLERLLAFADFLEQLARADEEDG